MIFKVGDIVRLRLYQEEGPFRVTGVFDGGSIIVQNTISGKIYENEVDIDFELVERKVKEHPLTSIFK